MNRLRTRTSVATAGLAAGALIGAMALSGCSAGQVSQMTTQHPAINGTTATIGSIDLRNVFLRAPQTSDYVRPGADVELLFVVVNSSDATSDKLLSIESNIGEVELSGNTEVPAGNTLIVGVPDHQDELLGEVEGAETATADVTLDKDITNGLLYEFTFKFEKAGEKTIQVPISAGEEPRRDGEVGGGGGHSGGGH